MARTKRKRTPEEIQQAIRDNEHINATPAAPEEPAAKKRRQARRWSKRYNLNKEFQALNVAGDVTAAPVEASGFVDNNIAQPPDVRRDERPPPEPTVQTTASATAATAVAAPSNSEQPSVLTNAELARRRRAAMTASQQERTRARDRERARARRANMRGSQRDRERLKNAERSRARRALLTESDRDLYRVSAAERRANRTEDEQHAVREHDRLYRADRRANTTPLQRQTQQEVDRLDHEERREQETAETREARREGERIRQEERRANQTQEEVEAERVASREYHASLREARDEEEQVDAPQRERIRRSTVRRGHALANQANFRVSMLSGPNIVNGRHRLPRTTVCPHCNAWKWPAESKNVCCLKGAVRLPPLQPAPPRLLQLYEDAEFRRQIRAYNQVFAFTSIGASCSNRSAFRDVNQDETVAGQHGVYTYRIQGAMGHYLGSLLPRIDRFTNEPVPPKFAQIYIVDPEMQQRAERRRGIFADLDSGTLLDIEQMMAEHNPFAQQFLNYAEKLRADRAEGKDVVDLVYRLHEKKSNPRTHNLPTVSEVGATLIEDGNLDKPRDILLWAKDHRLLRLFESNPMYDPLQYPLLLPHGDLGWTFTDEYADNIERRSKREMSLREHVAYRLFQKVDDESALHQGGRLFQQYCVDQRAKCEQEQLRWIASHQAELRADQYRGVQDALLNEATAVLNEGEGLLTEYDRATGTLQHPDGDQRRPDHFLNQIGKRIVLPSTHSGSPRAMYKSYQDSMAIVREYGKPDVFVTMTCNPTWEEIEEKIPEPNQSAQDRPDIVARVWQQKLAELLKDLDEGVLGRVMARIYVVEFQKRGLPHAHILVILADEDKPRRREIIDKLVSAELPDADVNPQLYETILTSMMHGPCGAANPNSPCMKDGKCTKGYPKPLVEVTQGNVNGFPVYRRRRRPPGVLKFKGREYDNATINQWVVPYNPYLSQKYNCHINVEVCTALTAVKYLYKYVYKGSDKAVITVETVRGESHRAMIEPNEILRYLNARYISPVEACMRLLEFSVQGKTHSIVQLTIHLENEQLVTFRSSDNPDQVLTRGRHTMLTRFFELCASEAPENQEAKTMVYQDIPKKFRWDAKTKRWVRRKQFQAAIGRMVHVSPRDMNKFYMRVLLCHRKGPQSFELLRTVDGVTYETYREAALKLGYLEDDAEWVACMTEAAAFKKPYELRQLFATIIVYSQVSEVRQLWDQFYDDLSEDYSHTYRALQGQEKEDLIQFKTLKSLHDLLQINGYKVADFDDLPQLHQYPELVLDSLLRNSLLRRELEGYDQSTLQSIVDQENQLNDGQRAIYDEILQAVDGSAVGEKLFFIDGPGGTGKSTLLRHILAKVRLSGKIAIAVASSGIASLLLMGGRTAHSTFKIPLKLNDKSTCAIYKQSNLTTLIQRASLVIWDEAPMTHRHAFEAVDRTLRDIMGNDQEPFGGKVFVLSGDFRQILPVVVRGTPAETIDACLKSSSLWSHFKQLHLTENMRVQSARSESTAAELAAFSEFLLQLGEGRHEVNRSLGMDFVKIPRDMLIDNTEPDQDMDEDEDILPGAVPRGLKNIIDVMYADINNPDIATDEYFADRAILTTTNAVVQRINEAVSQRLSGDSHEYLSVDSVDDDNEGNFFEPEVLHTVNINGIPPHKLTLKEGAPIMMMRNLNPDLGLCNGTRLRVVKLKPHVIHATIMTGERQGQHVLIPRIVFLSDGDSRDSPFRLRRKQFPVVPAFAMTINKAQGQTVQNLGLYLATPCFSHGQLYVALSRVTSRSKFKALIEYPQLEEDDGVYTDNIVYRQIFDTT